MSIQKTDFWNNAAWLVVPPEDGKPIAFRVQFMEGRLAIRAYPDWNAQDSALARAAIVDLADLLTQQGVEHQVFTSRKGGNPVIDAIDIVLPKGGRHDASQN